MHSKRNNHKRKRRPTKWEKILKNQIFDKWLVFKIYLLKLIQVNNNKKIKNGQRI